MSVTSDFLVEFGVVFSFQVAAKTLESFFLGSFISIALLNSDFNFSEISLSDC